MFENYLINYKRKLIFLLLIIVVVSVLTLVIIHFVVSVKDERCLIHLIILFFTEGAF